MQQCVCVCGSFAGVINILITVRAQDQTYEKIKSRLKDIYFTV